jgi:hypothetical protein
MTKLIVAAPFSILAVALLAGCFTPGPNNPASAGATSMAPVAQPVPYWSGTGVVQAVNPAPGPMVAGPNASSRNPSASAESGLYRLHIRMDDGRMMYVDTPSRDFSAGTRVQLTDNNEIRRL